MTPYRVIFNNGGRIYEKVIFGLTLEHVLEKIFDEPAMIMSIEEIHDDT